MREEMGVPQDQLTFEWATPEAIAVASPTPFLHVEIEAATTDSPWDFRKTFPPPRADAQQAGFLGYDEVDDEVIRSMHDEHARHCRALLHELDALAGVARTQTDPFTGKTPRTEKQQARLRETLQLARTEVHREFIEMMVAYANVFGDAAADAFRATIMAWHRADETDALPAQDTVEQEQETPTDEAGSSVQYDPGHPWHYLAEGDGAEPMSAEKIPAGKCAAELLGVRIPSNARKRTALLEKMLVEQREQLNGDIARYNEVLVRGPEALSRYDREIAYGGNDSMGVASTIALKFNHIVNAKGRVAWLESQLGLGLRSGHCNTPTEWGSRRQR